MDRTIVYEKIFCSFNDDYINKKFHAKFLEASFDIQEGQKLYLGNIFMSYQGMVTLRNNKGNNSRLVKFETENNNLFEEVKSKNKIYDSFGKEIKIEDFEVKLMD